MTNLDGAAASIDVVAAQSAVDNEAAAATAFGEQDEAHQIAWNIISAGLGFRIAWPARATIDILPLAESLHLTGRPVIEIIDVQDQDGNDLEYTVESGHILKLVGYNREQGNVYKSLDHGDLALLSDPYALGNAGWPTVPYFRHKYVYVTYTYGKQPPPLILRAIEVLATEIQKSIDGDTSCALPKRVTSITRQGVSMTILDPQKFFDEGRTGIYEVDLAIVTYNPTRAKARARVFSPAHPPRRRAAPIDYAPSGQTNAQYDMKWVDAGSPFTRDIFYFQPDGVTPIDLTGFTAHMQIRRAASSSSPLIIDTNPPIDGPAGKITFDLTAEQTALLIEQQYVYAIEIFQGGDPPSRLVGGRVFVRPEVVF